MKHCKHRWSKWKRAGLMCSGSTPNVYERNCRCGAHQCRVKKVTK